MKRLTSALVAGLLVSGGVAYAGAAPQTKNAGQSRPETCEGCHAEAHDELIPLADGDVLSAWVDPEVLARSVHGSELTCTDCHRQIGPYPHEASTYDSRRDLRVSLSKTCNRCHYAHFEKTMDSIHFEQLEAGDPNAPTCVDCHGAHDIEAPSEPRGQISDRCGSCHEDTRETYVQSVHGAALTEGSEDVPVCTDCHGAHGIEDPETPKFKVAEHDICAKCHADEKLMGKYDLSANVLSTYLDDFHGTSNQLYEKVGLPPGEPVATCSDCHGYHGIKSMDDWEEVASVKGRSEQMCAQCHEGATDDFAAAWLSHDEPTLRSAPLVWSIQWGYRIMIPMIMLGLVLHILMDLIQVRTHREGSES